MGALLSALAWLALATALEPIDALPEPTRRIYAEGRDLERGGDPAAAAVRYRTVADLEPSWTQAVVDLGRVLEAQDLVDEAHAAYARAPFDRDAVEASGRLALARGDATRALAAFVRLRDLRPDTAEFLVLEAQARAALDPLAARDVLAEFLDRPAARLATPDGLAAATAIAVALHGAGEAAACREVLDRVRSRLDEEGLAPDDPARERLTELEDGFALQDEATRLARAEDRPLEAGRARRLAAARAALREGRAAEARDALDALVAEAPQSAAAWGALADAAVATGDLARADQAATEAERLAPLDPMHAARLGDLLVEGYAGRHDADAAAAYARAVARPGAPEDLWFRKGLAELRSDQPDAAAASLRRFVALVPDHPNVPKARAVLDGLGRARPELATEDPGAPLVGDELRYWTAVALARPPRGEPDDLERACAELDALLASNPDDLRALDLASDLRARQGELAVAIQLVERSLAIAPDRGPVEARLAELYRADGRAAEAEAMWVRAADHGAPEALLELAERDLSAWRLWAVGPRLAALEAATALDPAQEQRYRAIGAAASRRTTWLGVATVGGLGLAVAWPLGRWLRRRRAAPLDRLLEAHPAVWPEVARQLSALRHEVLKHHTSTLDAVADALDRGDPEPARWAASRLEGPRGAIARFRETVAALERLGRLHGVPVDLRAADPVFRPLVAAMDRLEGLLPDLRRGQPRAAPALRAVAEALNGSGYHDVGGLLQRLCLLPLDRPLIDACWASVTAEARRDEPLHLELPDERPRLRIYRGELDDVLTNLLRNALQASEGEAAPSVGVRVSMEDDPITGLERVEIRVLDRSSKRLSTAMIRSRYIGRGLGLAVDLVSHNGGSIHVESEPGWAKAVVVRLPRAEVSEEAP